MTHEPPRRPRAKPTPPAGRPARVRRDPDGAGAESERPTVNPPFDVEAFARASAVSPMPPAPGLRRAPAEAPTVRPPSPDGTVPEARAEQITLTNEVELEKARAQSAGGGAALGGTPGAPRRSEAPRYPTPGPLSMANARAPSAPNMPSALSMANARAPSAPSIPAVRRPSPSNIEAAVLGAIRQRGPGDHRADDRRPDRRDAGALLARRLHRARSRWPS